MSSTSDSGVSLSDVKLDKVEGYNTTSDQPVSVAPVQALASPEILQVCLLHNLPLLTTATTAAAATTTAATATTTATATATTTTATAN